MSKRREFLQLAHTWDPSKHGIAGWYVSEKYDGMRAYWDGGISRGIISYRVPYANTLKDACPRVSTGLWSRYGKVISAPDYFLDSLPRIPLDGELYLGKGSFQQLVSIVKRHQPDDRWKNVKYIIFDIPGDAEMFQDGRLTSPNFKTEFVNLHTKIERPNGSEIVRRFTQTLSIMKHFVSPYDDTIEVAKQYRLPLQTDRAIDELMARMDNVILAGGEGLILRKPESIWTPQRTHHLLKVKRFYDSEAMATGVNPGKGKLEGLMGSLIVFWKGKTFELSGFTDRERSLTASGESKFFPPGTLVTFKYRELTTDGIPKEARYLREAVQ